MPVFATCAGLILLARTINGSDQHRLGLLDIGVKRNEYGSQVESFEALVQTKISAKPIYACFIRAPVIHSCGSSVQVLGLRGFEASSCGQSLEKCAAVEPNGRGGELLCLQVGVELNCAVRIVPIRVNQSIDLPLEASDGSEWHKELPDTKEQPDKRAAWNELQKRIMEQVDQLPPLYREALILRNVEDMSYEQIAEVLDCKLGTIKSRIARAREELRKRLVL